tara:strand:+ start:1472 stop:2008 length:537 start_codon:yes stop_codon:yes gene_type:complete
MSELRTNRIIPRDGLVSGTGIGGGIIQVKSTTKTNEFQTTSTSLVDVTGLSVTITPTRSDSKILIIATVNVGTYNANFMYGQLVRGSTHIFRGDAVGNRPRRSFMYYNGASDANEGMNATRTITHMDEPATTNATTYKIQIQCATTGYAYVNRSYRDTNTSEYDPRVASSITVMEVCG